VFEVEFYEDSDGNNKLRAKVFRSLKLLESFGNRLGEPDTAPLRDGIFELRTRHSSNIVHCLYFYDKEKNTENTISRNQHRYSEEAGL